MIEATSIKNMFKGYKPVEMAKRMGTYKDKDGILCDKLPRVAGTLWTNGHITFFDYKMPKSLVNFGFEESDTIHDFMTDLADGATIPAYPVMMGTTINRDAMTDEPKPFLADHENLVKFDIPGQDAIFVNGMYVVNLVKMCKSRKKDKKIEWFYNPKGHVVLLVENGKRIGLVAMLVNIKDEIEQESSASVDDDHFDVDGTEYDKSISDARKIKVTSDVIGGIITEKGLTHIENVSKSKRKYAPNYDALDAFCETLPEDAFYLGLWCTTMNKSPGKAHYDLAQEVWDDDGAGILVITPSALYGIGKDETSKTPDKFKITLRIDF